MKKYIVDGSNVFLSYSPNNAASFSVLLEILIQIEQRGDDFFCIFDANIEHKVKQKESKALPVLRQLLTNHANRFSKVTGGIRADDFILICADKQTAIVISNDRFSEYLPKYTWLDNERNLIKGNVLGSLISLPHMDLVFPRSFETVEFLLQQLQDLITNTVGKTAQDSEKNLTLQKTPEVELTATSGTLTSLPLESSNSLAGVTVLASDNLIEFDSNDYSIERDTTEKLSNRDVVDTETTPIQLAEPLIYKMAAMPTGFEKAVAQSNAVVQEAEPSRFLSQSKQPLWFASLALIIVSLLLIFYWERNDERGELAATAEKNGVWRDEQTKIVWMRCSIGQVWTGKTCAGKAAVYTWEDAQKQLLKLNAGGGYAGYTDWSLPSIEELMTLVRCDKGFVRKTFIPTQTGAVKTVDSECRIHSTLPAINKQNFPENPLGAFWSATLGKNPQDAWQVAFDDGYLRPNSKKTEYHIRLSRKEQKELPIPIPQPSPKEPLPVNSDKVWVFPKTGMMWMPCSMGQTLVNKTCQGERKQYTWREAQDLVKNLNRNGGYAGYTDWTLPHIEDLFSLSLCRSGFTKQWFIPTKSGGEKMVKTTCKMPNPDNQYWSSTVVTDRPEAAWARGVNFGNGTTIVATQNNRFSVWLVRQP